MIQFIPAFFMKKLFLLLLVAPCVLCAQSQLKQIDSCHFKKVIGFLASDSLKGRADGTRESHISVNFIDSVLEQIPRCKVSRMYFQTTIDSIATKLCNVAGFMNNHSDSTVVFIAHYDHIGLGGPLSLSHCNNEIHNGADDNASGVALLLAIASGLAFHSSGYNYLFVATSGHENGLFGAKYLQANFPRKYRKPALIVNFDMVGRMDSENTLFYDCSSSAQHVVDSLMSCSRFLKIKRSVSGRIEMLDTNPFAQAAIPCITFSTGRHSDYHKTSDDEEYINYRGMMLIYYSILDWMQRYSL